MNELQEAMDAAGPEAAGLRTLLDEFVELEQRRRDAEGEVDSIKRRLAEIDPLLREEMSLLGMQSAKCRGLTVYVKTDEYVSKKGEVTTEQIVECLKKHGCEYMVSEGYSAASLKAKVREWRSQGLDVPPQLAEMLNIGEIQRLATRKG